MKDNKGNPLNLTSLNHVSLVCASIKRSIDFYQNVLGFSLVRRPGSFDFEGAWLFGYGIGIHLLHSEEAEKKLAKKKSIPRIIIFLSSMGAVENKLKDMEIKYAMQRVEEGGVYVDQLFFHDPDGFMIEICNCDNIPMIPLTGDNVVRSCSRVNLHSMQQQNTPVIRP